MSTMLDPYRLEVRVYHPDRGEVEFVKMPGRNAGHCFNLAAKRFPGWVVTRAEDELWVGEEGKHYFTADGCTCVNCGGLEWQMPDSECSGVYGLL